ncbi:E3 ubiquitin-protein ligase MARCH3-like protein [Leptotrombidium deliense]|uniref:E3 ubiquitin-protein ligase MARCH3-like protein n=1 Tax=Leptotrombidium deliense TaxID=299467 RepID=A0A443SJL1_9ACAR|nr:E3 ubiquitin-protein ligase MARCH3-like protein [Leptotrombidium deliense]
MVCNYSPVISILYKRTKKLEFEVRVYRTLSDIFSACKMVADKETESVALTISCEKEASNSTNKFCKFCLESTEDCALIKPCECRGSAAHVHEQCLALWFSRTQSETCEICNAMYSSTLVNRLVCVSVFAY